MYEKAIAEIQKLSQPIIDAHPFLHDSITKMCRIVELDPQMAATRARICCEYIFRDLYRLKFEKPKKTPLGKIIGALQEKEPLPSHVNLATDFVRNLGNITSHPDPVNLDQIDDYLIVSAFNSLIPLLRWYLEQIGISSNIDKPSEHEPTDPPTKTFLKKVDEQFHPVYKEYFKIWKNYISWGTAGFSLRMKVAGKPHRIIDVYPREGIARIRLKDTAKWGNVQDAYNAYDKSIYHINGVQTIVEQQKKYIPRKMLTPDDLSCIFQATDTFAKAIKD